MAATQLAQVLAKYEQEILSDWLAEQQATLPRDGKIRDDAREQSRNFLRMVVAAIANGTDIDGGAWKDVTTALASISRERGLAGFSPTDTAMFVFSLKKPVFSRLRKELSGDALADAYWVATEVLDRLGLRTMEIYQKTREDVIERQQQDMLELSTPVVKLWRGILALPMIGTLDSGRTQIVMEQLLQKIMETEADVAILDITGVPTVDTLVAQHLLKTVAAARLMGADCIISGVRPQIAQTMVHLAIDMGNVTTKATLADAFALALKRQGVALVRQAANKV